MDTSNLTHKKNFKETIAVLMRDKKFKSFLSMLYSLGASVVVLGALFKIQHWPGAGFMLSAGLITEALIFFVYAFEPNDDADQHDHITDKLSHDGIENPSTMNETGQIISGGTGISLTKFEKMLEDVALTPDVFFKFGEGMKKLGETTENMNSIVDVSTASLKYMETIKKADESLEKTAKSYEFVISNVTAKTVFKYKSIANSLSGIESGAREFEQQMSTLNKNLSALNAVYKQQKKEADEFLKDQAESAAESKIYREQIKELNKNLAALNHLYSNMLSAVKTK
ncbi:MAG: gliding motility protein GldL [Paludibacter sp.]|nr:gliding motility protein GldL [Paludibacter sp.]